MINLMFEFNGDIELVVVEGNEIMFGNIAYGSKLTTIEGLKLDYGGVIREFPDLELENEWREIAIERLKNKLKEFSKESDVAMYVIDELRKFGHKPLQIQKGGWRWRKVE